MRATVRGMVLGILLAAAFIPGCAGTETTPRASLRADAVVEGKAIDPRLEPCLKEGELCNPLNDKCCDGYYCFGGLVPTCFRKP